MRGIARIAAVMQTSRSSSSWKTVLASPPRASHILQIYDSNEFLTAAVAHFAAEGVKNGEAVLLTGTKDHLAAIDRQLASFGIRAEEGQLLRDDVHQALARVVPHREFQDALTDPRFTGLRWWGEVTNTLCQRGEHAAGLAAEREGDEAARKYGAAIFCSYMSDRYDPRAYDETLTSLCCLHSHVIPAEDYALHRQAVNRAVAEVVGDIRGTLLQSLNSWKGLACDLPSSQAILFWLRETLPEKFEAVLERARAHHAEAKDA
jgi:hypothetical protein